MLNALVNIFPCIQTFLFSFQIQIKFEINWIRRKKSLLRFSHNQAMEWRRLRIFAPNRLERYNKYNKFHFQEHSENHLVYMLTESFWIAIFWKCEILYSRNFFRKLISKIRIWNRRSHLYFAPRNEIFFKKFLRENFVMNAKFKNLHSI